MAEVIDGILIREVETKNIMTKSSLPVGGYSVNPYVGCTHACNKSCPGDWLYSRLGDLAAKVTAALGPAPTEADPAPEPAKAELYRVRKTWSDAKSQKGAYKILANAKKCADANPGYSVFDSKGTLVYPENYRVHTVVHGDTLWKIAAQYLGDGSRYKEIVSQNG